MNAINLTAKTWESVTRSKLPIVVNFWAPWCSYCKALEPVFEELAKEYKDRAVFAKLNIYAYPEIADGYGVKALPVVKIFSDGKAIGEFLGFAPKELLKEVIDQAIGKCLTYVR